MAAAEQPSHSISAVSSAFSPSPVGWGMDKILGGDRVRTAVLNWPNRYFKPCDVFSAIKAKRMGEWGRNRVMYVIMFVF